MNNETYELLVETMNEFKENNDRPSLIKLKTCVSTILSNQAEKYRLRRDWLVYQIDRKQCQAERNDTIYKGSRFDDELDLLTEKYIHACNLVILFRTIATSQVHNKEYVKEKLKKYFPLIIDDIEKDLNKVLQSLKERG